jgi:uncharacterized membrane protein YfcA
MDTAAYYAEAARTLAGRVRIASRAFRVAGGLSLAMAITLALSFATARQSTLALQWALAVLLAVTIGAFLGSYAALVANRRANSKLEAINAWLEESRGDTEG